MQAPDPTLTGTVIESAAAGLVQVHWMLEYAVKGVFPGTTKGENVPLIEQIPSFVVPESSKELRQLTGPVLASLIGIVTVAPLIEVAVVGATTTVSSPMCPFESAVQVASPPGSTYPFGAVRKPVAAIYAFFSVLPHCTLLMGAPAPATAPSVQLGLLGPATSVTMALLVPSANCDCGLSPSVPGLIWNGQSLLLGAGAVVTMLSLALKRMLPPARPFAKTSIAPIVELNEPAIPGGF